MTALQPRALMEALATTGLIHFLAAVPQAMLGLLAKLTLTNAPVTLVKTAPVPME